MERQWRKLTWRRLWTKRHALADNAASSQLEQTGLSLRRPLGVLPWLIERQAILWDYCSQNAQALHRQLAIAHDLYAGEGEYPLVMIGHTKAFESARQLLRFATENGNHVKWSTISAWLDQTVAA